MKRNFRFHRNYTRNQDRKFFLVLFRFVTVEIFPTWMHRAKCKLKQRDKLLKLVCVVLPLIVVDISLFSFPSTINNYLYKVASTICLRNYSRARRDCRNITIAAQLSIHASLKLKNDSLSRGCFVSNFAFEGQMTCEQLFSCFIRADCLGSLCDVLKGLN